MIRNFDTQRLIDANHMNARNVVRRIQIMLLLVCEGVPRVCACACVWGENDGAEKCTSYKLRLSTTTSYWYSLHFGSI